MPWALPRDERDLLTLAKTYPFDAPDHSFLFRAGAVAPIEAADFGGRTAVIGHGSNRAPEQLRRKYGDTAEIPVTAAWLAGYDVVYSAHITQYGSIASALRPSPGCRVRIFVNWLDAAQLARMHETEGPSNYRYGRLSGLSLALDHGPADSLAEARVYMSTRGFLSVGGRPAGLAAVPAQGRDGPALDQVEALDSVRGRHRAELALDDLILGVIREPDQRRRLIEDLGQEAIIEPVPDFQPLGGP